MADTLGRWPGGAMSRPGSCTLVGAGPGDPELLTLKAVKAIAAATVLLVDDLVDEGVLVHARPGARIVRVGKRGGCRSTPQAFIEALMIAAVRDGEHVVRLKGGDPFVFGRGGEEVERLRAAGIACTVISGVTAALAAGASLGVPLTHRDHAQGVMLVTGHARAGSGTAHDPIDWRLLAATARDARLTLVIYMGVAGAAHIRQQLLAGGLPPGTPAAVVQNASLPRQRQLLSTLDRLADDLAASTLGSPAVLVLGEVLQGLAAVDAQARRFGS
ncbi:MAG: uroporphyrinogen-III C-methyltransferase [Burkholderiaceae bacterium]